MRELGFGGWGLGFRDSGLGFGDSGCGCRVQGLLINSGFWAWGLE